MKVDCQFVEHIKLGKSAHMFSNPTSLIVAVPLVSRNSLFLAYSDHDLTLPNGYLHGDDLTTKCIASVPLALLYVSKKGGVCLINTLDQEIRCHL